MNISSREREEVKARLQAALPHAELSSGKFQEPTVSSQTSEEMPADLFDGAMKAVFHLMETDSLTTFKLRSKNLSLLEDIVPAKPGHALSTFEDIVALPLLCNLTTIFESKANSKLSSSEDLIKEEHQFEDNFSKPRSEAEQACSPKTSKDAENRLFSKTDREPADLEHQRQSRNDEERFRLREEALLRSEVSAQDV